eukprot:scaffold2738_cov366-Prasinococcus_capsulatus_cf.AAC.4
MKPNIRSSFVARMKRACSTAFERIVLDCLEWSRSLVGCMSSCSLAGMSRSPPSSACLPSSLLGSALLPLLRLRLDGVSGGSVFEYASQKERYQSCSCTRSPKFCAEICHNDISASRYYHLP